MRRFLILAVFYLIPAMVMAQGVSSTSDSARVLFNSILRGEDNDKMMACMQLEQLLSGHFSKLEAFATDLDSLPYLGQLRSDDGKLLLVCWNIVLDNSSLRYYCIAFFRDGKKKDAAIKVFPFEQSDTDWQRVGRRSVKPSEWYGALYYRILTHRHKKSTYYTLLGWDGSNPLYNRKLVDVLDIAGGRLMLGAPMFVHERRPAYRLVFSYAKDATMSLNWDEQQRMVVMDHLAPEDARLKGQFQFYGPDFSYDGLEFQKGKWVLIEDLNATNKGLNNLDDSAP